MQDGQALIASVFDQIEYILKEFPQNCVLV